MVRRFLDRKILFRSLGLAAVGSAGVIAHQEYSTFNEDFSYSFSAVDSGTNGANRKLSTPTRIKLHIREFASRYGINLGNKNERFLSKIMSKNAKERNEAINFISLGTDWLDGPDGLPEPERDHVLNRVKHSKIIPGLARLPDFKSSLFLDPPVLNESSKLMSDRLLEIFNHLPSNDEIEEGNLFTPCVKFFTQIALDELNAIKASQEQEDENLHDDERPLALDLKEDQADIMLLKALRRHADVREHMGRVPTKQLFRLLYRCLSWSPEEPLFSAEAKEIALRTIANLALNPRHQSSFIQFGFHKVLREIADDASFETSSSDEMFFRRLAARFQAIRALANLDQDDPNSAKYEDGVFLVHPPYRTKQAPKFDVVFIHGLGGGVSSTWTTKDTSFCSRGNKSEKLVNWLDKWVSRDLKRNPGDCRILGIDYETAILYSGHHCPYSLEDRSLNQRAKIVGERLRQAGVGERPTVFVCYSMGGLVMKKILQLYPYLGQNTKGIVFLATPHHGSPTAELSNEKSYSYLATIIKTFLTPEILMLGGSDEDLGSLNDHFMSFVQKHSINVLSWGELLKSDWGVMVHIVPPENANPKVGQFRTIEKDHDGMVMPIDEVDPIYSQNLTFIRECLNLKHKS